MQGRVVTRPISRVALQGRHRRVQRQGKSEADRNRTNTKVRKTRGTVDIFADTVLERATALNVST